jgi:hypothetical protein
MIITAVGLGLFLSVWLGLLALAVLWSWRLLYQILRLSTCILVGYLAALYTLRALGLESLLVCS